MIQEKDLSHILHDWLKKLEEAIAVHNGEGMCEASRMVVSICSILWAYYPQGFTEELRERVQTSFKEAVSCITNALEEGQDPDGYYNLYKRNISERLQTLEQLKTQPSVS